MAPAALALAAIAIGACGVGVGSPAGGTAAGSTPAASTPAGVSPSPDAGAGGSGRELVWANCEQTQPTGIATDDVGNVFVADFAAHVVVKLDRAGRELLRIGEEGSGPGELENPAGVAVADELLYVADHGNDRIALFSLDGEPRGSIGKSGRGLGEFSHPVGVAVAPDGTIYVGEDENRRIQQLEADGTGVRTWTRGGSQPFEDPVGVAVGASGIWAADYRASLVYRLSASGRWMPARSATGSLAGANLLAIRPSGAVVVANFDDATVAILSPEGEFERYLDLGADAPPLVRPWGVAADDQLVYLTDVRAGCVLAVRDADR